MRLADQVVVVTGGAGGIGAALARRFAAEGAAAVVVADLDPARAAAVAGEIGGTGYAGQAMAYGVDVTDEGQLAGLVESVLDRLGRIDLFCSNAGVATGAGLEASTSHWQRSWAVNVLAHVYAARAVLPSMLGRGSGYLLHTCSAAGLLTAAGDAPYTVTKHAAVGFAEWLAVTYGDRGIRVSALCPQGVDTPLLAGGLAEGHLGARVTAAAGRVLAADEVAEAVVAGLAEERFLILPHPEVARYVAGKATDPDRWLTGMRAMVARLPRSGAAEGGPA